MKQESNAAKPDDDLQALLRESVEMTLPPGLETRIMQAVMEESVLQTHVRRNRRHAWMAATAAGLLIGWLPFSDGLYRSVVSWDVSGYLSPTRFALLVSVGTVAILWGIADPLFREWVIRRRKKNKHVSAMLS